MYTQADKVQENTSRTRPSISSGTIPYNTYFTDYRPEAVTQRKLQELADKRLEPVQVFTKQNRSAPVQRKINHSGLPENLKSGIENLSGYAMDDVKVHYNSSKPVQLQALAFAQGTDIHLAPGQEKHLPHEAWHVVQQKQGRVKPTLQMKNKVNINDDAGLEKEADVMGQKALHHNPTDRPAILSRKSMSSLPVQRKVGVEYETTWHVTGNNRQNHKKPIYKGKGWHLESDNNNMEFVTYPPSNSPETLRATVSSMSEIAKKIRNGSASFDTQTVTQVLGSGTQPSFGSEHFVEDKGDASMSAKAQFSFGLSMKNMTGFFDRLYSGNLPEEEATTSSKTFNFGRNNETTTRDFLKSQFKAIGNTSANAGRKKYHDSLGELSSGASKEMQGFLSYLGYYIKSMEAEYLMDLGKGDKYEVNFTDMNRAAVLAQEIVKNRASQKTIGDLAKELGYQSTAVDDLSYGLFGREDSGYKRAQLDENMPVSRLKDFQIRKLSKYVGKRTKVGMDYPKYRFPLMNRSGFDKMYQALDPEDKKWFRDNIDEVIKKIGRKPDSRLFASPYSYKKKKDEDDVNTKNKGFSHGPTVLEWLNSIVGSSPQKRDKISPPKEFVMDDGTADPDQSMGLLAKMDVSDVTEYGIDYSKKPHLLKPQTKKVKQTIIELRSWGDFIKPETWPDHSYDMAYLFGQMAPGDLNFDEKNNNASEKAKELNPLLEERHSLLSQIIKITAKMTRGQKTHAKHFNRGLANKIAIVDQKIEDVNRKHG